MDNLKELPDELLVEIEQKTAELMAGIKKITEV